MVRLRGNRGLSAREAYCVKPTTTTSKPAFCHPGMAVGASSPTRMMLSFLDVGFRWRLLPVWRMAIRPGDHLRLLRLENSYGRGLIGHRSWCPRRITPCHFGATGIESRHVQRARCSEPGDDALVGIRRSVAPG